MPKAIEPTDAVDRLLLSLWQRFEARGRGIGEFAAYVELRLGPGLRPQLLALLRRLMSAEVTKDTPGAADVEAEAAGTGEPVPVSASVEELAFLLAEQAGFRGAPVEYWEQAERLMARRGKTGSG